MSEVIENQFQEQEVVESAPQPVIENVVMRSYKDMQTGTKNAEQEAIFAPPAKEDIPPSEPVTTKPAAEIPPAEKPVVAEAPTPAAAPEPAVVIDKYKEFGIDESQKEDFEKYVAAWKSGKLEEYVRVQSTDYDNMPAEDLVRISLKKENPLASPKQLDVLHKQYLKSLGVTEFSEDAEAQDGMEIYNLRAETMRDALKSEKAKYQIPEYKVPEAPAPVDHQAIREQMVQSVKADPNFQAFETKRIVTLGSGEKSYNYEVPKELDMVSATVDADGLFRLLSDSNGNLDMQKWIKTIAYAANMDKVESALIDFGESRGEKMQFESLNNPKPEAITAPAETGDSFQLIGQRSYRDINGR